MGIIAINGKKFNRTCYCCPPEMVIDGEDDDDDDGGSSYGVKSTSEPVWLEIKTKVEAWFSIQREKLKSDFSLLRQKIGVSSYLPSFSYFASSVSPSLSGLG